MVTPLLVVVLVLAVAVLVVIVVGFNKLRAADVHVAEALSGIDVELTRRAALIPALVQTVATFATHETAVLGRVSTATTSWRSESISRCNDGRAGSGVPAKTRRTAPV